MHILQDPQRTEQHSRRGLGQRERNERHDRRPRAQEQPHPLASALRVKNLNLLHKEIGEDYFAVLLGVTLQRAKELLDGVNFTDETAFHVENTLELPSGFLDQLNPLLTEEDRARLKTAHLEDRRDEGPAVTTDTGSAVLALSTEKSTDDKEISQMATATKTAKKAPARGLSEADLRLLRRENFKLLMDRPLAKKKLAELTGLSPANISHRLHGDKIFDLQEADYFIEKLGLPANWFDASRTEADIPPEVLALLTVPGAPPTRKASTKKSAAPPKVPGRRGRRPAATSGIIPAVTAPTKSAVAAGNAGSALAPARSGPTAVVRASGVARPAGALTSVTARSAMQASAGSAAADAIRVAGGNIGVIASALLHTLAAKARDGALTELHALKMLNEASTLS